MSKQHASQNDDNLCNPVQPFISAELKDLLPAAKLVRFEWKGNAEKGSAKPEEQLFDAGDNRITNLKKLVQSQGYANVIVSDGPWSPGAIIDGDDQFVIAGELKLPIRSTGISCPDLTTAKLHRWRMTISTNRKLAPFLVVKAFVADKDFQNYFDGLVKIGKQKMSEGGKNKRKGVAEEPSGFNRRHEAANFCMVSSWDFYFSTELLKDYAPLEKWEKFPDLVVNVQQVVSRCEDGSLSPKSAYHQLHNLNRDAIKSNKLANIGEVTNTDGVGVSIWTGEMNKVYQGDALEVLKSFPDEVVDRVVSSPFYHGAHIEYFQDWPHPQTWEEYQVFLASVLKECWRVIRPGGMMIIQIDDITEDRKAANEQHRVPDLYDHRGLVMLCMRDLGVQNCQAKVWYKGEEFGKTSMTASNSNPTNRINHEHVLVFRKGIREDHMAAIMTIEERKNWELSVWEIRPQPDGIKGKGKHPARWPTELARRIALYGAHRGDVLLDPFCGTGVVLETAAGEGMNVLGIDMFSDFVERSQKAILRGIDEWKDRKAKVILPPTHPPDFDVPVKVVSTKKQGKRLDIHPVEGLDDPTVNAA